MDTHNERVHQVSQKVKAFYETKQPFSIYHGSTNSTRASNKTKHNTVDISHLNKVPAVNRETKTVIVEPNVPMDVLVGATLPHGLIPPVVMEFPGITAGGGYSGTSGESSSYEYGFFERTVNWVEIILGNGEVVRASADENEDLFYGAGSCFGTLGITTLLEIRLIEVPPSPVVELTYFPFSNGVQQGVKLIQDLSSNSSYKYIDGIVFSKTAGVICAGKISSAEKTPYQLRTFSRPTDPWFYMRVEAAARASNWGQEGPITDAVPLVDYFFRYDRGGFWVGKYAFEYLLLPQTKFMRWVMDGITHTRTLYHATHKSGLFREYTIQDVAVPYAGARDLMEFVDSSFGQYPIWLCPVRQTFPNTPAQVEQQQVKMLSERDNIQEKLLNFGIWGPGPKGKGPFLTFNRSLESLVHKLGGKKWLYARTYYTEEEFWKIYDKEKLDSLREKYHATNLPDIYQKVKPMVEDSVGGSGSESASLGKGRKSWGEWLAEKVWHQWPLGGLYGLYHLLWNRDYLLQ
ncbi:hypothetical protein ABZX51_004138 [Aspergillus tubingensis]